MRYEGGSASGLIIISVDNGSGKSGLLSKRSDLRSVHKNAIAKGENPSSQGSLGKIAEPTGGYFTILGRIKIGKVRFLKTSSFLSVSIHGDTELAD